MKISEMIKAYGGLVLNKKDYWHPDMLANIEIDDKTIKCYYVDMRPKHLYVGTFDEEGIPLLEIDGEFRYFPVTIAQYALGNFDKYIDTEDEKYFAICERCSQWFVDHLEEIEPGVYGYINYVDKGIYKLEKPWLSSLAQAQVMSILARTYSVNHNQEYLDVCVKLLNSFEVESKDKGILANLNGGDFYEEYPSKTPSFVLNGFIFSLWGLMDFYMVSKNEKTLELYNKGVTTLKENISLYDIKYLRWSRYDLYPFKVKDITSIFYHNLHIEQLKAMYYLTGDSIYEKYATRWQKAKSNIFIYIIATLYKIVHKLSVRKESNYVPSVGKK